MFVISVFLAALEAHAQPAPRVVDLPTRAGVSERFLYIVPAQPKAAAILLTGGGGGLRLSSEGQIGALGGAFIVRVRGEFVECGIAVAMLDAPSDRQDGMVLHGFRTSAEHVADLKALIAWLRAEVKVPVWLMGTSRSTESAAYVATQLPPAAGGPDGIVLSASIVRDKRGLPVNAMALEKITAAVLVVHHKHDTCPFTGFAHIPELMGKLGAASRKELLAFEGGSNVGDPCGARAHHGFAGLDREVAGKISDWILQ